ncbi:MULTISPECIES: 4-(cytidine 5'-diphospho)-2-C-methyl-D-erythritol kinase [Gallibacterium]|uniref:4-diphosphocytidyl-2-C-methyl-D-erythritol kinase n=3 Tax=Gallibacterium TaxID=155493 RepID=U1GIH4_9PAST|nr:MULTISPECIES: 4-(cytidine 5'-diphospho)-2-C-methyl-D-erythritol kinase [Gallibacterium]ERF77482.1 4-diphosphocytidyl-2C-methyl-D-erythritol kinase [Gallibacterium anatis 12656/12]KGQ34187.1 kinase [Gallibacterium anatis]KGQ38945.1 kinase [Gallibacterium genomosp. 1]KGQ64450.1 kinase [Gallibacterium anatis]WKS96431.1 4-(cytidine 5'-diphospho)-2-C-methyl-D-erythritol kinase [Gallibacterium anatis]
MVENNSFLNRSFSFPCPAKLNLFLYINGRREDGYHELQTLFQFLDFSDQLTVTINNSGNITLENQLDDVVPEDNLIFRAAKLLQQYTQTSLGASLSIEKKLPMGGGVGGGSSDAATTLVALNYLWQTNLSLSQLAELGLKLGADVPIFVHGKAAFAEGVGEKISYCEPDEKYYVVLKPNVAISTAKIFQDPKLPRNTPKRSLSQLLADVYTNDCEKVVRDHYPEVEQAIQWLVQYAPTRLTGTGACIFAEFDSQDAAIAVYQQRPTHLSGFVAKGVNRSPLYLALEDMQQNC